MRNRNRKIESLITRIVEDSPSFRRHKMVNKILDYCESIDLQNISHLDTVPNSRFGWNMGGRRADEKIITIYLDRIRCEGPEGTVEFDYDDIDKVKKWIFKHR